MTKDWTFAETEYAIKRWKDGEPANHIAVMLNRTFGTSRSRNSVIGRLNRLGHARAAPSGPRQSTLERKAARHVARVNKTPVARKLSPPKRLPVLPPILADVSFARPWLERERGQCAFPLGERGAVMSCCFPTDETYCAAHRQAMRGKRKPWTDKDHRNVAQAA